MKIKRPITIISYEQDSNPKYDVPSERFLSFTNSHDLMKEKSKTKIYPKLVTPKSQCRPMS